MKKSIFIFFAVMAFVSCQKESPLAVQDNLKFTAGISADVFRTNMTIEGTVGKIAWEAGDEITVKDAAGSFAVYVSETAGNPATFVLKEGETALGAGPYSATYLSGEAKKEQTYYADKVPSVAMTAPETESTEFTFTASCGVLKLNVKGEGIIVKRIMMKGDNTDLYTLDCGAGVDITAGVDFYIALKQEAYKKIYLTNADGKTCIRTAKSGKEIGIMDNLIQSATMTGIVAADFDCIYLGSRVGGTSTGYPVCWADHNIGATSPEEFGYFFDWGGLQGYVWNPSASRWRKPDDLNGNSHSFNVTPSFTSDLPAANDAAVQLWGGSWRMPTEKEASKLSKYNTPIAWTTNYNGTGVAGMIITGNTGDKVFFPAAGMGKNNAYTKGTGFYWTTTYVNDSAVKALQMKSTPECKTYNATSTYGFPIRPVKD